MYVKKKEAVSGHKANFKMGLDENLSLGLYEQHRCRPACASAQSDQHLFHSLFGKYHI